MGTTRRALLEVGQCATYTKVVGRSVVDLNRLALITGWRGSFFRSYLLEQQGARPARLPGLALALLSCGAVINPPRDDLIVMSTYM